MKNTITIAVCLVFAQQAISQLPEDALRMSWNAPSGTARSQAIGGAMGSLGGEVSSLYVNPAGLGFFKVSEIMLTPSLTLAKSDGSYRGTDATSNNLTRFNMNMIGFVSASNKPERRWLSDAFSIAVNHTANFNNTIYYKGRNDYSSFSEAYAEELSQSGVSIDDVYSSSLSMGTKMAVYTYLIDTATLNGRLQVVGRPEYLAAVNQENKITTRGGITEIAIGYAANMEDKLYIGGGIGVPIVKYEKRSWFTESDPENNPNNNFNYSRYEEKYTATGAGFNARLGLIYKPAPAVRVGAAIHTPTFYALKERLTAKMVTDHEKLFPGIPVDSVTSDYYYGDQTPSFRYNLTSPWKFLISGSYFLHAVEDVTQQRGFITADVEYVTHGSSRFHGTEQEDGVQVDDSYYKAVNNSIKASYKGAFNFRVGAELKLNIFMVRGGFAYYGNPYKDAAFKASKKTVSGGLGYRNRGIFIDLTFVQSLDQDVNFPYRLTDKANTFADIKGRNKNILLTFGFKI
jgi:hypothetical protein